MKFKAKLRRIGNSLGVIIPSNIITSYKEGDSIDLNVITLANKNVITSKDTIAVDNVITSGTEEVITQDYTSPHKKFNTNWCSKHNTFKGTCGCK
jgi:antitoxin component of MazEF toxin-antitoxin module